VTPWVQRLLIANILVFFLQQTIPGLTEQLSFVPHAGYMLTHPWTMVTYMFVHGRGLWHIGFNMLTLYFFGPRVEQRLGSERFFVLYILSGICGALLSFLFNDRAAVIGASGAIFGVMFAYARFWPRDQVMLWGLVPIEVRWLVAISTLIALFGIGQGVAHFAHLGGFVGGYLYLLFLDQRHGAKRFKAQVDAGPPADALASKWQKVDSSRVHSVNRDEVNRILDKISASGLKSLTPQERLFLMNFVPPDDRPKDVLPS
jgi:membrane associated rhomboid family serine protease